MAKSQCFLHTQILGGTIEVLNLKDWNLEEAIRLQTDIILEHLHTDPSSLTDEAIEYYFSPLVSSPLRKAQLNHFAAALAENPLVLIESDLKFSGVPVRMVWGEADTAFDVTWADWLNCSFQKKCRSSSRRKR